MSEAQQENDIVNLVTATSGIEQLRATILSGASSDLIDKQGKKIENPPRSYLYDKETGGWLIK